MDPKIVTQLVENTKEIQQKVLRFLRDIDRRALNAMVLVKRHGNVLAGYGVIAASFRDQAANLQKKASEMNSLVVSLTESSLYLQQLQSHDSITQQQIEQSAPEREVLAIPKTKQQRDIIIAQEQQKIQSTLYLLLSQLKQFQEGINEQEYIVINGRIEAALSEGAGAPLMQVSQDMGEAVADVRQAIDQWTEQLERFAQESGSGYAAAL